MDILVEKLDRFMLISFGSYSLGTSTDDSDVDILCGCLGDDNIDTCIDILKGLDGVEIIAKVPSYIPLLKLKVNGNPVDITFVSLTGKCMPEKLMEHIEPTENNARAVNGVYVSNFILRNTPSYPTFVQVVKKVKQWAFARRIYGTMIGFPGGMAWTLMVAKIFQLDFIANCESVDEIFNKFLWIYRYWNWPTPVVINAKDDGDGKYKNWNPLKYPKDSCFMAVITPVYPTMNATYSVNEATLKVIQREIELTLDKPDSLDRNYSTIKLVVPENDDGSFKLKLKGVAAKLNDTDGVEFAHPFLDGDDHCIGLNCSKNVDVTEVFKDFEIKCFYGKIDIP